MLSGEQRRYIQYEVPAEAIFNPDRWDFAIVKRVVGVEVWESRAAVRFPLELSDGGSAYLEVSSWAESVLRFRFGREGAEFPDTSEMIYAEPEPLPLEVEQETEEFCLRCGPIVVRIGRPTWRLRLQDKRGELLRSHDSGPLKAFFPVYALGLQTEKGSGLNRVCAAFDLQPEEAIFGLGEKFGPLNKRGQRVVSWNSDTTNCSMDRAYKNVPFLMSTRGYGLFLHTSRRIEYEIGSWNFTAQAFAAEGDGLEWFFLYGPDLKSILERYTKLTGRSPVPPLWSFGLWMSRCGYKSRQQVEEVASELRKRSIPCDVLHLDPWWMREGHFCDFEWDTDAFPKPEEMLKKLSEQGFKVCLWEQPYVPAGTRMYSEGTERGYFVRDAEGEVLHIRDFLDNKAAIVDFTNPEARAWYQQKHRVLLEQGVAVFKTDMGEAVPREGTFADGRRGDEMHNLYPLLYAKTVWEETARKWDGQGIVWGRSGYAGSQRYPLHWGGDSISTYEEMAAVLRGGLSLGMSGFPFWSQDIGGFHGEKPSPALYVRWAQWGLFNSHSRCHGVQPREPWEYGPEAERIFRAYTELRYRLLPYIWSAAHESSRTGLPMMRPLVLEFQDDPTTWNLELQYLFGPWILVVPVFDESGHTQYYLPNGLWLDFWSGEVVEGPCWQQRRVALEEMPLFLRDGALIPKAPATQYVGQVPWDPIDLDVFLSSGESQWTLRDEQGRAVAVEARRDRNTARLRWSGCPVNVLVRWLAVDAPDQVVLNAGGEKRLPAWRYLEAERRLEVAIPEGEENWELVVRFSAKG